MKDSLLEANTSIQPNGNIIINSKELILNHFRLKKIIARWNWQAGQSRYMYGTYAFISGVGRVSNMSQDGSLATGKGLATEKGFAVEKSLAIFIWNTYGVKRYYHFY